MKTKYTKAAHRIYTIITARNEAYVSERTENQILTVIDRTFDPDELDNIEGLEKYPAFRALIDLAFDQYELEQFNDAVNAFFQEMTQHYNA